MKTKRNINLTSLLSELDSNELSALRKQFNQQLSESMHKLEEAEKEEMRIFVDGLNLDRSRYWDNQRNCVSLISYNLPLEQRKRLDTLSNSISRAFKDLQDLKREVALECTRSGQPYSKVFCTSLKRMKKYKAG